MKYQRTSVGLDVHALSEGACALDSETGELFDGRLTLADEDIWAWLKMLPGPIKVTYEVGLTGYGLGPGSCAHAGSPAWRGCSSWA